MKKILLIEDNDEVRDNTAEILEMSNYKVFTAENGKEGVEVALEEIPDLIICDIMMPVLDGYGVLHMLSKQPSTAGIPFIFLTAKSEKADFRKGMEMGADDYITKPFDGIELLNAVEARLKKAEALKQTYTLDAKGINDFINNAKHNAGLKLISDEREVNDYKRKQTLYSEGQRPVAVYFIIKGKVKVSRTNDDMKELITNIYTDGDFFGYTAILEETNYKEGAEILEDAELMLIPRSDFMELINNDATVARQFIKLLTRNIIEKEESLLNLAYSSLRKKVANGLLLVLSKFKGEKEALEISRENLANIIGSATESLIRTLSDFKSEGLIDIKKGKIVILNENKLRNLLY